MVCKHGGQIPLAITAPTQKAGFRVPKTILWLIKHWFPELTFVLKSPPIANLLASNESTIDNKQ
jgi:hypothetical protein